MSDKIESYLNYIMSERKFSSCTIANYKEDLKQYEDFVISQTKEFDALLAAVNARIGERSNACKIFKKPS